jgi:hypothetical protein
MLLAYMDEAGNTGRDLKDKTQPIHYIGALLVAEIQWQAVHKGLQEILKFAKLHGFHEESDCELHGAEIFQGKKGWNDLSLEDRLNVFDLALKVAEDNVLRLVVGACNKPLLDQRYKSPFHPHEFAAWLCLEKVAQYAKSTDQLVVLIGDDGPPAHKKLVRDTLEHY